MKQSTNYILQGEIDKFQKGYENILQNIMNPSNLFSDKDKSDVDLDDIVTIDILRDYLNVGVCYSTPTIESSETKNPENEIYIKLFVIKGELNDENKNILNCMYKGDYLRDELHGLLNNGKSKLQLNVSDFNFDIDSKEAKAKIKESIKANEKANPPPDSVKKPKSKTGGFKRRSRRNQKRKRRTRKTRKLFFI